MQKGTCSVCDRINVRIFKMPTYEGRICFICYRKIRWVFGDARKRKMMKIKKDSMIKLTVWY